MRGRLEYDENVFRDKLADQLAHRDHVELHGLKKIKEMDVFEVMSREEELAHKYTDEFIKNGVENLRIVNPD